MMSTASSRQNGSYSRIDRGLNRGLTILRSRVWRGGSVSIIERRAASSSGRISSSVIPSPEANVAGSLMTRSRSRYLVTAQNPRFGDASSCHRTGRSRRRYSNHSNGNRST